MLNTVKFVLCGVGLCVLSSPGSAAELFNIDFSAPTHLVGYPPAVGSLGSTRNQPSYLRGSPLVVYEMAGLNDRPLELSSYCQNVCRDVIGLRLLDFPYSSYSIRADVSIWGAATNRGTFEVALGASYVSFSWQNPGVGPRIDVVEGATHTQIGSWSVGVPLEIFIRFGAGSWSVFLDQTHVYSGSWQSGQPTVVEFRAINDAAAALDNIVITGSNTTSIDDASWGRTKARYR